MECGLFLLVLIFEGQRPWIWKTYFLRLRCPRWTMEDGRLLNQNALGASASRVARRTFSKLSCISFLSKNFQDMQMRRFKLGLAMKFSSSPCIFEDNLRNHTRQDARNINNTSLEKNLFS